MPTDPYPSEVPQPITGPDPCWVAWQLADALALLRLFWDLAQAGTDAALIRAAKVKYLLQRIANAQAYLQCEGLTEVNLTVVVQE